MKPKLVNISFSLSIPKIWMTGEKVFFVRTAFLHQLNGLFSACKIVHVKKPQRDLEIQKMKWWQSKRPVRIGFNRIDYIDLIYPEMPVHENHQPGEIYDLFLITKNPFDRVHLIRFGRLDAVGHIYGQVA